MLIESEDIVKEPTVSVIIFTYNQEKFITQSVESALMQQTDFPFEIIINDDCSKDNTTEVCKAYQKANPHLIRLYIQDSNQGIAECYKRATDIARGKYLATIAGDDYWILKTKLQIQKDYLDTHPECGLCYTNINTCDENSAILEKEYMNLSSRSQSFEEHLESRGYIAPLTWMYRRELLKEYTVEGARTDESFALALDAYAISEVHYLDMVTANYRLTTNSLSRLENPTANYKQWLGVFRTQQYYMDKYSDKIEDTAKLRITLNEYIRFIPMAIELCDDEFVNEARVYCSSQGIKIEPYIDVCKAKNNAEKVKKSKAYHLGKSILKPFKWMKWK